MADQQSQQSQQSREQPRDQSLPGGAVGRELRRALAPGEQVLAWASGKAGATLVATERRAIIIKTGIATGTWFGRQTNSYGYAQISGVEVRRNATDGYVELSAGGVQQRKRGRYGQLKAENIVPFNKWSEAAFQQVVDAIRARLYNAAPAHASASDAPAARPDIPAQIAALARLRDQGVLSEAEFAAKKADLLRRM